MKALIFHETGEPKSVLKLAKIPTPPLATGDALVRVRLSPINASDLHMVRGRYGYQPELPASPGIEGVGVVEAVVRHFGFLANRRRAQSLPLCFAALDSATALGVTALPTDAHSNPGWFCPKCGGAMVVIERFTTAQIQLRSPPQYAIPAA